MPSRTSTILAFAATALLAASTSCAAANPSDTARADGAVAPAASSDAHAVLARAFHAMGGRALLENLHGLKLDLRTVAYRIDDSERADGPYWLNVGTGTEWIDEAHDRSRLELDAASAQWPVNRIEIDTPTMAAQGVMWQGTRHWFARVPSLVQSVALRPERILMTAAAAPDLHALPDRIVHHQKQHVLAFTFRGHRVRLDIDAVMYLPSRLEITGARKGSRTSVMLGDVAWDMDYLFYKRQPNGLVYPHQLDLMRDGQPCVTTVVTRLVQDAPPPSGGYAPPADAKLDPPNPAVAYGSQPIDPKNVRQLAPAIWMIKGPWNVLLVRQPDGIVVVEAPQSGTYSAHVLGLIAKRFPGVPVKAVVSTTDSTWHIAGLRTYVARGIPVYVLDANETRVRRLVEAPRTLEPDELARHPRPAHLVPVHGATTVGTGPARLVIHPIRGHGDERMMMVYFPAQHLLYGSSNDVNPQQVPKPRATFNAFELVRRVDALDLPVRAYVAIHTAKMPWREFRHITLTQPAISSRLPPSITHDTHESR